MRDSYSLYSWYRGETAVLFSHLHFHYSLTHFHDGCIGSLETLLQYHYTYKPMLPHITFLIYSMLPLASCDEILPYFGITFSTTNTITIIKKRGGGVSLVVPTNHLQFVSHTLVSWLYSLMCCCSYLCESNLSSVKSWCKYSLNKPGIRGVSENYVACN